MSSKHTQNHGQLALCAHNTSCSYFQAGVDTSVDNLQCLIVMEYQLSYAIT